MTARIIRPRQRSNRTRAFVLLCARVMRRVPQSVYSFFLFGGDCVCARSRTNVVVMYCCRARVSPAADRTTTTPLLFARGHCRRMFLESRTICTYVYTHCPRRPRTRCAHEFSPSRNNAFSNRPRDAVTECGTPFDLFAIPPSSARDARNISRVVFNTGRP